MTTFDRAFIKAFADSPSGVTPNSRRSDPPRHGMARESKRFEPVPGRSDERGEEAIAIEKAHRAPLPLSSFAAQPVVHDSFRALLEIDRASWPEACQELLARATRQWDQFVEQLIDRMSLRQKCIAISSMARGDGRTTVSLALARHVAARGLRPVVVDVDPENPMLAQACGVSARTGWDDLVASELALGEALITNVEEGVTLMPWRGPAVPVAHLCASLRTCGIFGTLREHYDLVLLDTLPLVGRTTMADLAAFASAIRLDALYLIHNARSATREQTAATCAKLRRAALPLAGLIENFASPTSPNAPSGHHKSKALWGRKLAVYG